MFNRKPKAKPKSPLLLNHFIQTKSAEPKYFLAQSWKDGQRKGVWVTHRLIRTDGMDLGAKHHRGEDEKEEALKAQEDEEDDCSWR